MIIDFGRGSPGLIYFLCFHKISIGISRRVSMRPVSLFTGLQGLGRRYGESHQRGTGDGPASYDRHSQPLK